VCSSDLKRTIAYSLVNNLHILISIKSASPWQETFKELCSLLSSLCNGQRR